MGEAGPADAVTPKMPGEDGRIMIAVGYLDGVMVPKMFFRLNAIRLKSIRELFLSPENSEHGSENLVPGKGQEAAGLSVFRHEKNHIAQRPRDVKNGAAQRFKLMAGPGAGGG